MITGILVLILILMFIYGLYAVAIGKFGLRQRSMVKGRTARFAGGSCLVAPIFWILVVLAVDVARIKNDPTSALFLLIVFP